MSKVVVTGVSGAFGQRVAALLSARPDVEEVAGVDIDEPERLGANVSFVALDLAGSSASVEAVLDDVMARDLVLHLAWSERGIPGGRARRAVGRPCQHADGLTACWMQPPAPVQARSCTCRARPSTARGPTTRSR